jgi:carbon monoxide dehydrogenase subunit G
MITIESTLVAQRPVGDVWDFFTRVDDLATCVPTCVRHRVVDENTVDCDLRLQLGLIPLENRVRMTVVERRDPVRLVATGVSEAGDNLKRFGKVATETVTKLSMTLDLESLSGNQTRIHYHIRADAVGQMKRVYEAIIRGQRDKLEQQFVQNVSRALGGAVARETMHVSL